MEPGLTKVERIQVMLARGVPFSRKLNNCYNACNRQSSDAVSSARDKSVHTHCQPEFWHIKRSTHCWNSSFVSHICWTSSIDSRTSAVSSPIAVYIIGRLTELHQLWFNEKVGWVKFSTWINPIRIQWAGHNAVRQKFEGLDLMKPSTWNENRLPLRLYHLYHSFQFEFRH